MTLSRLHTTIAALLCVVIFGVCLQAPIAVWADTHTTGMTALVVKSWKEILLGVAFVLMLVSLVARRQIKYVLRDKFVYLPAAIALLHVLLLIGFDNAYVSEVAGLVLDVRMYLIFVLCYTLVKYCDGVKFMRPLLMVFVAGAVLVLGFALLQITVLPRDVLSHIGYSSTTIQPYLTVDLNQAFVRINSTLRGPNPLGAYAILALSAGGALLLARKLSQKRTYLIVVMITTSILTLWSSYSRGAWLGALAAVVVLVAGSGRVKVSRKVIVGVISLAVVATVGLFVLRENAIISNVVFHNNPHGGSEHKSDMGHMDSLQSGIATTLENPLGTGVGSTGSASLHGASPVIVENQFLYMAHESGWLGLLLQVGLLVLVLIELWRRRLVSWVNLAVVASGVGLVVIGFVLPVWTDDTIALLWWAAAGLALSYSVTIKIRKVGKNARKSHQKTKRTA